MSVTHQPLTHPTFPEGASAAGQTTKAEAMRQMLENWNAGLEELAPHITEPDEPANLRPYGTKLQDTDLAPIPERDLPPGLPLWMGSLDAWARASRNGQGRPQDRDA